MSERIPAGGLYRTATGIHEPLSLEHLRLARYMASTYCRSREFCREYIERTLRASILVAKARINDLVGTDYTGLDSEILSLIDKLVEFYAKYLAGLYVLAGEDVLAKASTTLKLPRSNAWLVAGDIAKLKAGEAAALFVAGLIEPIETGALRIVKTGKTRKE
ncbi:MAG: hypothetical protein F7C07_01995 [Desulfurococcales archaeon]|nr:hypothetical protein [Desulfurococcales archaeon]